ncbi:MAG: hypothetical protein GXY23_09790 [Myxococcales bacterium]|nr:hypothetical protein [Myxococcales bacterium]
MAVRAGYDHTCALVSTGAMLCWGRNPPWPARQRHQAGHPSSDPRSRPADVGRALR